MVEEVDDQASGNILSNGIQVMIGQSNVSPGNVPEVECYWGQDEHPLVKGAHDRQKTDSYF